MATDKPVTTTPTAKRGPKKIMFLVVAIASLGGGAALPMVMGGTKGEEGTKKKAPEGKSVNVPFGDVTVNLSEERMQRYLRVKIILKVTGPDSEEEGIKLLAHHKPALKTWLISHLSGKAPKDVAGSVGVNRLQREIKEKFEEMLSEEGAEADKKSHLHLKDVLFEDYIVQ